MNASLNENCHLYSITSHEHIQTLRSGELPPQTKAQETIIEWPGTGMLQNLSHCAAQRLFHSSPSLVYIWPPGFQLFVHMYDELLAYCRYRNMGLQHYNKTVLCWRMATVRRYSLVEIPAMSIVSAVYGLKSSLLKVGLLTPAFVELPTSCG